MKKITSQIVLIFVITFSSILVTAQDLMWDTYDIEAVVAADQLDSYAITATSSCQGEITITWEDEVFSGGCYGHVYRTYTATDACGDSITGFQIIEIAHTSIVLDEIIQLECSDPIPEADYSLAIDDPLVTVEVSEDENGNGCDRTITRTYLVTDGCGNQDSLVQEITITDSIGPTMTGVPANVTIECGADIPEPVLPIIVDNCDASAQWEMTESVNATLCGVEIVRMYRAFDACGNQSVQYQTITVEDTTPPVFDTVVEDATINCSDLTAPPIVTATDACDDNIDLSFIQSYSGVCPLTITRTWTASDMCNNTNVMTQVITVIDEENPVWNEFDAEVDVAYEDLEFYSLIATDNCDDDVEVTWIDEVFSGGCYGNRFRTFTATDNCGNEITATQIIHVYDVVNPTILNVPDDVELVCGDIIPPVPTNIYTTDNAAEVGDPDNELTLTFTEVQTETSCPYQIIRTWTAEDHCGNQTVETQVINVNVQALSQMMIVSINPNPITNQSKIQFVSEVETHALMDVYDMNGRKIEVLFDAEINANEMQEVEMNVNGLEEGIYIIRLQSKDNQVMKKIVISK